MRSSACAPLGISAAKVAVSSSRASVVRRIVAPLPPSYPGDRIEKAPRGTRLRTGDRQDCQRISGKERRKFMAVLSVPGSLAVLSVPDRQPGPPCPYHPSLEPLVERAVVHVRRIAVPRIGGRRLRGNVPLPFPASQPLGLESVSVLRAARAVHVRAGSTVLERARHPPAAARLARSGVSHHRRTGDLFGACHPVLLRAPLY